jgi:hypothetical protein
MAIALKIDVPWNQANRKHTLHLALVTTDGEAVIVPAPDGTQQRAEIQAEFEVGRPPGVLQGAALDYVLAITIQSIPIPPGQRYEWRLSINGHHDEDWTLPFTMRSAPEPGTQITT